MIKLSSTSSLLGVALCGAAGAQDAAPARPLTIQPTVGASMHLRTTQTSTQVIEAMGHETSSEQVTELHVAVDDVAKDGTVTATLTWLRMRGTMQSPMGGGEMEFDTAKPDEAGDPMLEGLIEGCTALIGNKTRLTFSPDGNVKDKKPLEELADKVSEKLTGQAKMMFQGIVGMHVLEQQATVFGVFPTEPVAVGGTWTTKRDAGGRGGLNLATELTHKLSAVSDDAYEISTTGVLTAVPATEDAGDDDDEGAAMMRNMMRDAKVKDAKITSATKISRKDGIVQSSTSATTMAIHMNNPMGGDEPFVVGVKQNSKVERFTPEKSLGKEAPAAPKK
jgi:hypothetical protein